MEGIHLHSQSNVGLQQHSRAFLTIDGCRCITYQQLLTFDQGAGAAAAVGRRLRSLTFR